MRYHYTTPGIAKINENDNIDLGKNADTLKTLTLLVGTLIGKYFRTWEVSFEANIDTYTCIWISICLCVYLTLSIIGHN